MTLDDILITLRTTMISDLPQIRTFSIRFWIFVSLYIHIYTHACLMAFIRWNKFTMMFHVKFSRIFKANNDFWSISTPDNWTAIHIFYTCNNVMWNIRQYLLSSHSRNSTLPYYNKLQSMEWVKCPFWKIRDVCLPVYLKLKFKFVRSCGLPLRTFHIVKFTFQIVELFSETSFPCFTSISTEFQIFSLTDVIYWWIYKK